MLMMGQGQNGYILVMFQFLIWTQKCFERFLTIATGPFSSYTSESEYFFFLNIFLGV